MAKVNKDAPRGGQNRQNNAKLPTMANVCDIEERLRRLCERDDEAANIPITETFIKNISIEIMQWAEKPDSLILSDFYNPRGYNRERLNKWSLKYPVFDSAFQYAKETVGARRIKKRIIETNCDFTISEYSSEWREKENLLHQRKLELASAKDKAQQPTLIQVIAKNIEDCPEVLPAPKGLSVDQT